MGLSITREHRALLLLALDFSGSMTSQFAAESSRRKADQMRNIAYSLLYELVERARRGDGVRNYYDIGVLCYRDDGVESAFGDRWYLPVTRIADGEGDSFEQIVKAVALDRFEAEGATPMLAMMLRAEQIMSDWVKRRENQNSIAPILINITDGMATDATNQMLIAAASRIGDISTQKSRVMIVQNHLRGCVDKKPLIFPNSLSKLNGDSDAELLYAMASNLPLELESEIRTQFGISEHGPYKMLAYNCSAAEIISLLSIGTSAIRRD